MPPSSRPALWALFAFNHEIAKTREIVTETTIGLIRLQWWRDALGKIYDEGKVPQNEVLPDVCQAIQEYDLPREWFETLIYAREFDLENVPPETLAGLENYADFTNASLLKLALKVLGQDEDEETIKAMAVAYGLTGLLRAVSFHAAQQRSYMPADLMAEYDENITEVSKLVAVRAFDYLKRAQPQSKFLKVARIMALLHLKQVKTLKYDVFSQKLSRRPIFFHLRFLFKSLI